MKAEPSSSGCTIWKASLDSHGYGQVYFCGKVVLAHRLALSWREGRWLGSDEHALHSCDNRACVNPDHLFVGDNAMNVADKMAKGRHLYGSSRFSAEDVLNIRRMRRDGVKGSVIAGMFGVDPSTISKIASGARWPHV